MPRAFTRCQALQNAAFLRALARTGNAREAARAIGAHRATFTKRRAKHPAFAAEWDAALALAQAALNRGGEGAPGRVIRTANGRLQLRRTLPSSLTCEHEQRFLAALSASANVRLSAAAAGFSHSAFYLRAKASPAFAREWRMALQQGYEALEMALVAGWSEDSHQHDAWRHNAPPPVPPMTVNQALQLLYLHQKKVLNLDEPPHSKRRRGESSEAYSYRLGAMHRARQERDREAFRVAEAARLARGEGPYWSDGEQGDAPQLPDLAQVTGWSKADATKTPHDDARALFGGWRIGEGADRLNGPRIRDTGSDP
ncbi:hypothetical protein [Sphingomonas sp.]|uniref:hypothetical protein n=1 Tax=Sphingomonas sp. TaxID=28214 RepID=UPI002D7F7A96|nr:hypothetical protein [Sphingomonas sp.]HEU0045313.1 hypothetical protein [Sphingomonas sp.]